MIIVVVIWLLASVASSRIVSVLSVIVIIVTGIVAFIIALQHYDYSYHCHLCN